MIKISVNNLLLTLTIMLICMTSPLRAQDDDTIANLQRSIDQARTQISEERDRIQRQQTADKKNLEDAQAKKNNLVDQIVKIKFEIAQKQALLAKRQATRKTLSQQIESSRQQFSDIRIIAEDISQRITAMLDRLPPSESRDRQHQLLSQINASVTNTDQGQIDITPIIELLESVLTESTTAALYEGIVLDSKGYETKAQIFRLGQLLYACKTKEGITAIAAPSAQDDNGYRWNENIPSWAKDNINDIIIKSDFLQGSLLVPLDITQQMTAQQGLSTSLLARITAGGPVMIPLVIIAVIALVLIIERLFFFAGQSRKTVTIAEAILAACHSGEYAKAETIAAQNKNIVSRTMLSCLTMRREKTADMEDAIAESILHELPSLERFLSTIAILAGVAPLLGLLGTVTGMISTFDAITIFGSGQPKLMSGGISQALITTAAGLIIAIPILLLHSFLSTRSDNLIADTERYSATLLNLLKAQKTDDNQPKETGDA